MTPPSARSPMTISAHLRYPVVEQVLATVPDRATITEIGAGRGAMASRFAEAGYDYVGYEPDPGSFAEAERALGDAGVLHNRFAPDVPERVSDVVVAFEVLEHIEDDMAAAEAWYAWLKPGGTLIISVPAHDERFGPWDAAVGHFRRYERDDLTALLEKAGFVGIDVRSVGFPIGLLLEAVRNRLAGSGDGTIDERTAASGRRLQPSHRGGWVTAAVALPFRVLQRPFEGTDLGTGYVASARRPLDS